jgi:putative membrane protein
MMMYGSDMSWWAWGPMMFGTLLVVGLLVWLLVRLVSDTTIQSGPSEPSARQILDARFARGEIGEAEYERARRILTGQASATPGSGSPEAQSAGERPLASIGGDAK